MNAGRLPNDPQALGGAIEAMVRLRLQQADELPSEAVCTQAVNAALDVLRSA